MAIFSFHTVSDDSWQQDLESKTTQFPSAGSTSNTVKWYRLVISSDVDRDCATVNSKYQLTRIQPVCFLQWWELYIFLGQCTTNQLDCNRSFDRVFIIPQYAIRSNESITFSSFPFRRYHLLQRDLFLRPHIIVSSGPAKRRRQRRRWLCRLWPFSVLELFRPTIKIQSAVGSEARDQINTNSTCSATCLVRFSRSADDVLALSVVAGAGVCLASSSEAASLFFKSKSSATAAVTIAFSALAAFNWRTLSPCKTGEISNSHVERKWSHKPAGLLAGLNFLVSQGCLRLLELPE